MDKIFGKMENGSMRGSILMLTASCFGPGVMTFSNLCVESGIILVLLTIIASGIGCFWSHYMIT
jgi:hypothetical protein